MSYDYMSLTEITELIPNLMVYISEVQKIFNMITTINNIEEASCNEFGKISSEFNASIKALKNEMIQHYTIGKIFH